MRGGNYSSTDIPCPAAGLSPHARGKLPRLQLGLAHHGPIPAYAGETLEVMTEYARSRAYPRIRGGNPTNCESVEGGEGLSPHTRGKQVISDHLPALRGPIPAYAGETGTRTAWMTTSGAYPRIRGGNVFRCLVVFARLGLSPHTRGKPGSCDPLCCFDGPIPAYAGETQVFQWRKWLAWAYPRIRGGNKAD